MVFIMVFLILLRGGYESCIMYMKNVFGSSHLHTPRLELSCCVEYPERGDDNTKTAPDQPMRERGCVVTLCVSAAEGEKKKFSPLKKKMMYPIALDKNGFFYIEPLIFPHRHHTDARGDIAPPSRTDTPGVLLLIVTTTTTTPSTRARRDSRQSSSRPRRRRSTRGERRNNGDASSHGALRGS